MSTPNISVYAFEQLEKPPPAEQTPEQALGSARAEAEAIREQARAEGEAAGYAAGIERAKAESGPMAAAIAEAVQAVAATRAELVESLTRQAGEISVLIAEQIVAGTFAVQPDRIVDVTRGALRRLADRHHVTVLVNPDDLELLSAAVLALQTELGGIDHLDVQADRRIARGGAVAQTAYGEIDASIGAQIQAARELVEAALSGDTSVAPHADSELGELVSADGV